MIAETLKFARGSLKYSETLVEYHWTKVHVIHVHDVSGIASTSFAIYRIFIYLFVLRLPARVAIKSGICPSLNL